LFALRLAVHSAIETAGLDWSDIAMISRPTRHQTRFLISVGKLLRLSDSVVFADHKPHNNSDMRYVVVRRCSRTDSHWQRRRIHRFVIAAVVAVELEPENAQDNRHRGSGSRAE